MKKSIFPFDWRDKLDNIQAESLNNDLVLIDKPFTLSTLDHLFKIDVTTAIICVKGTTRGMINLKELKQLRHA